MSAQSPTQKKGQSVEQAAAEYLCSQGLQLLEQNFRCKLGEIDLIMNDAGKLVFVEVRYRKSSQYGSALASVTAGKQRKLRATAQLYLKLKGASNTPARFDVVGVQPDGGELQYRWCKNAF